MLYQMIDTIKYHLIPIRVSLVDYDTVKAAIFHGLYNPIDWPDLSNLLYDPKHQCLDCSAHGRAPEQRDAWPGLASGH